jgi:hypothetical protein
MNVHVVSPETIMRLGAGMICKWPWKRKINRLANRGETTQVEMA